MGKPELWRLVASVPGLLASNRGRIMIAPKIGKMPHGGDRHYGGYARKGSWDGNRYIFVHEGHSYKVARLVCEAWHGPSTPEKNVCMHLDENARNNCASNLQWGTQKENLNAPGFIEYCKSRTGDSNPYIKGRKAA